MTSANQGKPVGAFARWLRTWPRRYGLPLGAVIFSGFVRYELDVDLGFTQPFILFYPVIMLMALLEGFWVGLLTTMLSAGTACCFFLEPLNSFAVRNPRDIVGVGLFVLMGTAMSGAGDIFRRRAQRLEEFEKAVEGLEEMIAVVDRDYRYLIANRAFLSYRGLKRKDVIGRYVADILNPGVFESSVKHKLDECFGGRTLQYEMRYRYPTRGDRELLISYFPIEGPEGVNRVACVLQDTTDQKERERSLRLFRTLIDQSNDAVEVVDPETLQFLDVNEKSCQGLGYTREEMLAMTVYGVDPKTDTRSHQAVLDRLKKGEPVLQERTHKRKDGSTFPVETSLKFVQLDRSYVIAVSRDISERVKAEAVLRESEDRYRDLVENSEDLVCTHDLEGKLLSLNRAPARILGYEVSELLGTSMGELIAPEFRAQFDGYLERMRTNGADRGMLCVVTRSGQRQIWEYSNSLRTEGIDQPIVRGMAHDVTERKMAEQALRQREEDYRQFVAQSSEGIFREELDSPLAVDLPEDELVHAIIHGSYVAECNDAMAKMYGFESRRQLIGKRISEMLALGDPRNIEFTREYIRSGFRVLERESHELDIHGNPKVFRNSLIGIVSNGQLARTWGIQRDVTEQVRLEQASAESGSALRKSEEHFRILVEQATDGIFLADPAGRYLDVNTSGAEMLGYTRQEILQLSVSDVIAEEEVSRLPSELRRFAGGATIPSDWIFRRKDGSCFFGEVCGKQLPDGRLQGILRDVTQRKKAEEQMRRSEERFRVALKDSPITVFNQDRDLRYTWIYNPQLHWQHQVLGKTDEEVLGQKKGANLTGLKQRVLKTGLPIREEVVIPTNGKRFAFDMSIEPLFDTKGEVIGITGACMDIARLRELADRLQVSRDRLAREKSYLENEIQTELGFETIIGQSPALVEVLKKARVVAPTDSTVLVLGETGTGKELVARSIHALSSRRNKTFVKLNCAAVPSGLLESELFGHEKGAFTSAVSQKIGRIELADKGTLFLDEIGELPLELQPKLLRVLQDREFERLGGVQTLRVDVRIISATNRDLQQDVACKKFREDLFYRLNVFPIEMPPLRERRGDIPILVNHFVNQHSVRMGKHIEVIPDETMRILKNWNWPGNIRELENTIERMIIMTKGPVLAAPPAEFDMPTDTAKEGLSAIEREHIIRVLRETNGVLSGSDGAAGRLGLKRTTLQSMLKRLGIEAEDFRRGNGNFG